VACVRVAQRPKDRMRGKTDSNNGYATKNTAKNQMRADRYVEAVIEKCANLRECGMWPSEPQVRPTAWLQNFEESERPVAAVLLEHFIFFSGSAVDRMLLSGFRRLRNQVLQRSGEAMRDAIINSAVFTAVEGERPNPTDSGLLFCRKLRQILGIPDERFMQTSDALEKARIGRPVVFLDDFIGSGDQFVKTWSRKYSEDERGSFASCFRHRSFGAFYISLAATERGMTRIRTEVPMVTLCPGNVVTEGYGISSGPRSAFLPDIENVRDKIEALLDKYKDRFIVPPYMDSPEFRKYGYHQLGLQLAFEHSTPDATLPIFWAEAGADWTPLVRRT
jgi:hypothetical protein